jgi:predicted  nucleic acid-binding Zn-ribbon protein
MGLHLQKFNQRLQNMNQSGGRELILGAKEARDLQHEIFALLDQVSEMEKKLRNPNNNSTELAADGGGFK